MNARDTYNGIAQHYGTRHSGASNPFRKLEKYFSIMRDAALDVGCGTGRDTIQLASRFNRVVAIDVADKMIEIAKRQANSDNVIFFREDIQNLRLPDEFNTIWANAVIHHIPFERVESVLSNFLSMCQLGSRILITSRIDIRDGLDEEYIGFPRQYYGHTIKELTAIGNRLGLREVFSEEQSPGKKKWIFLVLEAYA
ncbi:MAG: class I SAM-dependent methyltransferase [Nevskia sp.]|jgi:2-polyprenyl-3-methyl-5-hydroxy-6-metoxy-1,4-benzoquinol methylase|nr:class I SAM-dependent methyltransferase [Nevskia sp.]MCK9383704.1 class I SAM-dependent methyltransferase [Nevskia sp.]